MPTIHTRELSSTVLTSADWLRLTAAVAVVPATLGWGPVGFALSFLVLGGTMVPRALGVIAPVDVGYCLVLLIGAWAALLDWYVRVAWLDLAVHAVLVGLLAVVGHATLLRLGAIPPRLPRVGAAVFATGLGTMLALLWEFGEWAGHTWIDDAIQVGYTDTLGDLAASAVGAAVAGVLLAASSRRSVLDA